MTTRLDEYIQFIELFCLESQIFMVAPGIYNKDLQFEVQWVSKHDRDRRWSIRESRRDNAVSTRDEVWRGPPEGLSRACSELSVDMAAIEGDLSQKILSQVVFARSLLEGASEIFDESEINNAEKAQKTFEKNLQKAVQKWLSPTPKLV